MAIGVERFEARNHSVMSGGGSDVEAMAEGLPLADGLTNQSIEKALGRFAEAAASSPTVSWLEQAAQHRWVWRRCWWLFAWTNRRCSFFFEMTSANLRLSQQQ